MVLFAAAAGSASAQVTAIVTGGNTQVTVNGQTTTSAGHNKAEQTNNSVSYGNYQVVSDLTPNDIQFANNASAEGPSASVTSSTRLAVTFTNGGNAAVTPKLSSQITPGGFGLYAAQNLAGGDFTVIPDINASPPLGTNNFTFDKFSSRSLPYLAGVSFSIRIMSGGDLLENLSGDLALTPAFRPGTPSGYNAFTTLTTGGDAGTVLTNFRQVTANDSPAQIGYQWDTTDLMFTLPGGPLAPGASRTVTYFTQVTAFSSNTLLDACGTIYNCPEMFAYSGFGDPIGKGTGGTAGVHTASGVSPDSPGASGGVTFPRFSFGIPTFDPQTGTLSMPLSQNTLPSLPLGTGVPEPATWVMMLAGFGGLGAVLRRRLRHARRAG